jgi:pimeloyl-ACP methyl ester carboxylesterase
MPETVYYLPGWGGRLNTGLGQALMSRGLDIAGRETRDAFKDLGFTEQVRIVARDLQTYFWSPESKVIANSFGGYLFLHAQAQLPPYPGKVVLLSPIVGEFNDESREMNFVPPQAEKLLDLIEQGQMTAPLNAEIHTGELDWQSYPPAVKKLGEALSIPVHVVLNAGHGLPKEYVAKVLDKALNKG